MRLISRKLTTSSPEERLYDRIAATLDEARSRVARTVNTAMVHAYWLVGREIVEVEHAPVLHGVPRGLGGPGRRRRSPKTLGSA